MAHLRGFIIGIAVLVSPWLSAATTVIHGTVYGLRTGAVLNGVTVTNGRDGGIAISGGEAPEIRDCTISGNQDGGVDCYDGSLGSVSVLSSR